MSLLKGRIVLHFYSTGLLYPIKFTFSMVFCPGISINHRLLHLGLPVQQEHCLNSLGQENRVPYGLKMLPFCDEFHSKPLCLLHQLLKKCRW